MRIDEHLFKSFEFGIVFCQNGKIDNKDTVFKANLRRSQSNTIGIVHRLKHVLDQLLQTRIICRINIFGNFSQNGLSVNVYR